MHNQKVFRRVWLGSSCVTRAFPPGIMTNVAVRPTLIRDSLESCTAGAMAGKSQMKGGFNGKNIQIKMGGFQLPHL